MKRVLEYLFAVIIFLTPTNLFLAFLQETGYSRGIFVDYLIPKVYFSDFFILAFILLTFLYKKRLANIHRHWIIAIFLIILAGIQFFSANYLASFYYYFSFFKIILLYFLVKKNTFISKSTILKYSLLITVFFQSALGLYQFITQKPLLGYILLGEQNIAQPLGIVHQQILGAERAIPYGTTAHPNILGGVIGIYSIFAILYWRSEKNKRSLYSCLLYVTTPLALITLWCTQSATAWLTTAIGTIIFCVQNCRIPIPFLPDFRHILSSSTVFLSVLLSASLLLPFGLELSQRVDANQVRNTSISRRVILNKAAVAMFLDNPLTGVGLNQFTAHVEKYSQSVEIIRFVQPAHNILLLWTAETGIIGLSLLGIALYLLRKKYPQISPYLYLLIPLITVDHYLFTLQTGMLLTFVSLYFCQHFREVKS